MERTEKNRKEKKKREKKNEKEFIEYGKISKKKNSFCADVSSDEFDCVICIPEMNLP